MYIIVKYHVIMKNRRGSIRATILPNAIILTKAYRAVVNSMAKGLLKESLHIILTMISFFEINQLHSLGYRQMITKEKIYEKISVTVHLGYNIQ